MKRKIFIQTFMFFFIIFIVKNIKFINIDWENPNILPKILEITYIITYILFFICILISIKEIMYFQKKTIGAKKLPEKVISLKKEKETSLIFFATYILPLVTIDIQSLNDFVAFYIILMLILILCWKTELWYNNPILPILGYKIYTVKCEDAINEEIIMSKNDICIGCMIEKIYITDEVAYARKK